MADTKLFAVKTTKSQESSVAQMLISKDRDDIHAALSPDDVVSYVFVESDNRDTVERVIGEIPHATKIVQGTTSMTEIESFLQPTSDVENLEKGAIVEITDGPFQGDKARITEVHNSDEKVTVEKTDATVPIPVTLRGNQMRVLDRED